MFNLKKKGNQSKSFWFNSIRPNLRFPEEKNYLTPKILYKNEQVRFLKLLQYKILNFRALSKN